MEEKMSYSFEMSFKEIKKEKLVDYMYENIGVCMHHHYRLEMCFFQKIRNCIRKVGQRRIKIGYIHYL